MQREGRPNGRGPRRTDSKGVPRSNGFYPIVRAAARTRWDRQARQDVDALLPATLGTGKELQLGVATLLAIGGDYGALASGRS
jgi:hypothetical protein